MISLLILIGGVFSYEKFKNRKIFDQISPWITGIVTLNFLNGMVYYYNQIGIVAFFILPLIYLGILFSIDLFWFGTKFDGLLTGVFWTLMIFSLK